MFIVQKFVRCVVITEFKGFRSFMGKNISPVLILNSSSSSD